MQSSLLFVFVFFFSRLSGQVAALVSVVCVFSELRWRAAVPLSSLQLSTMQRPQSPEQDLQHPSLPR